MPRAKVPAKPLTPICPSASTAAPPNTEVACKPVKVTLASASVVTVPNAEVAAEGAVKVTDKASPQAPSPQVPRPQPFMLLEIQ